MINWTTIGIRSLILFAVLVVGAVVTVMVMPSDERDDPQAAWLICKRFATGKLKSPSTATFPVYATGEVAVSGGDGSFTVESFVDSHNGFGAMVRQPFTCAVTYAGGREWTLTRLTFDK
jgi:hypothetical protein